MKKSTKNYIRKTVILLSIIIVIILISFFVVRFYFDRSIGNPTYYGEYGKNDNVIITCKDNRVNLLIYEKNELILSQNKIYYFLETDNYIYAITKWNEYIVIDLNTNYIILDTDNPNKISEEFALVFNEREKFIDFSERDYDLKGDIIYFGDSTISLESYCGSRPRLYTQKSESEIRREKLIHESIMKYLQVNNYIYLITEGGNYAIVDLNTYGLIYNEWDLSKLPENHQEVFKTEELIDTKTLYEK